MSVLDELTKLQMVQTIDTEGRTISLGSDETYVDVQCILEPSDYYSLIGTAQILVPLVSQICRDFGEKFLPKVRPEFKDRKRMVASIDSFENSVASVIQQLENDYLTSRQLELVMWSDADRRPIGVVDLDLGNSQASEIRTKLSGGRYHVIGKLSRRVEAGDKIDLLQKTVLSNTVTLFLSAMNLGEDEEKVAELRNSVLPAIQLIKRVVRLEVPGPAIRINAMSVCL
jgi:hypothetical protein